MTRATGNRKRRGKPWLRPSDVIIPMAMRRTRPGHFGAAPTVREPPASYGLPPLDRIFRRTPYLVVGAWAAQLYMPPRMTMDVDVLVDPADLIQAEEELRRAGARRAGSLTCGGSSWRMRDGVPLDLIAHPGRWVEEAFARKAPRAGAVPAIGLPWLVLMKLESGRTQDLADISRMLGRAGACAIREVRRVVRRWRPSDLDDLRSLVELGRRENAAAERVMQAGD